MNLRGTSLVVISACESGLGEVSYADGVSGLQRSLALAGVRHKSCPCGRWTTARRRS